MCHLHVLRFILKRSVVSKDLRAVIFREAFHQKPDQKPGRPETICLWGQHGCQRMEDEVDIRAGECGPVELCPQATPAQVACLRSQVVRKTVDL